MLTAVAQPIPQVVTAHEFKLVDPTGNVRAKLSMRGNGPALALYDSGGGPQVVLGAFTHPFLTLSGAGKATLGLFMEADGPQVLLEGTDGKTAAQLLVNRSDPSLQLYDSAGNQRALLALQDSNPALAFTDSAGNVGAWLRLGGSDPALSLTDGAGYETDIGVTGMVLPATGETQKTSAASIVMFDGSKKHHVIWKAPPSD